MVIHSSSLSCCPAYQMGYDLYPYRKATCILHPCKADSIFHCVELFAYLLSLVVSGHRTGYLVNLDLRGDIVIYHIHQSSILVDLLHGICEPVDNLHKVILLRKLVDPFHGDSVFPTNAVHKTR